MTLVAKPLIKDQYWIVTDGSNKVGNVIAAADGYNVVLNGRVEHCANTVEIMRDHSIQFEKTPKKKNDTPYAVWPTSGKTHNNMYDIKRRLHLYTKTKASKCYYVAGWFALKLNGVWDVTFCPKFIFIQRYPYCGPFATETEARMHLPQSTEINTP